MTIPVINTIVCPIIRVDQVIPMLKSLKKSTPRNYRTIVVNQTLPNPEFEEELYNNCDYVIRPHYNLGFAMASNLGVRLSPTPYVTVCNDDVLFIPGHDWFAGILETFERFPKAAASNPQSTKEPGWGWAEPGYRYLVPKDYPDEHLQSLRTKDLAVQEEFKAARTSGDPDLLAKLPGLREEMVRLRAELAPLVEKQVLSDPKYTEMLVEQANWAVVDAFACWCTVFRADALADIGMFDERFKNGGGEDYDFMGRAYQKGYRCLSTSQSWCWHWWGRSKDSPNGFDTALPSAGPPWNKLSTKGFGKDGLWDPDLDCWGRTGVRTDPVVYRASL